MAWKCKTWVKCIMSMKRETDRQTDRQTHRHTEKQANRQERHRQKAKTTDCTELPGTKHCIFSFFSGYDFPFTS